MSYLQRALFILVLVLPYLVFGQRKSKPCLIAPKEELRCAKVMGRKAYSEDCDCGICKSDYPISVLPNKDTLYKVENIKICRDNSLIWKGNLCDKYSTCIVFDADEMVQVFYKNKTHWTIGVDNISMFAAKRLQNNFLISNRFGYFCELFAQKSINQNIRVNCSANIKQGILASYDTPNTPINYAPFIGIDLSANLFIKNLNTFLSSSIGYNIITTNPSNKLYWCVGAHLVIPSENDRAYKEYN